jgi:hypothetical protein
MQDNARGVQQNRAPVQHVWISLTTISEGGDIRVTASAIFKITAQSKKAARTAQTVLGQTGRIFHNRDKNVFVK